MDLSCETILDFYTYRNRKVLCLIKVAPKSRKCQSICRTLSQEQWMTFDKELEKHLAEKNWNNEKGLKFIIKPLIEVTVHKSKLSLKEICKCLGVIADYSKSDAVDVIESNIVLECVIEFQLEIALISPITSQEYEPQTGSLLNVKSLTYEPYTPSAKGINVSKKFDGNIIDPNEDIYSPKPLFEIGTIEAILPKAIPKYIPAPIIEAEKHKLLKTKLSKSLTSEYVPESPEVGMTEVPIYIPTPIEEANCKQLLRASQIRRTKKRSNTIDAFPENLDEYSSKEKQSLKIEVDSKEIPSKKLKKRSMTIDEIPNGLVDVINTPSLAEKPKLQSLLKASNHKRTKEIFNATDELPENVKETNMGLEAKHSRCKNKRLRNRCTSIDDIQIDKNVKPKALITNSPVKDIKKAIEKRKGRRVEGSSTLITNSLTSSERSSSKIENLGEEQQKLFNKNSCKRYISSSKNKELFGTDDDDDDDFLENSIDNYDNKIKVADLEILSIKRPVSSTLPSSSEKTKSKRENESEGQQEKFGLYQFPSNFEEKSSKVLSLKSSTKRKSYKSGHTENRQKSISPTSASFELSSKNEKKKHGS